MAPAVSHRSDGSGAGRELGGATIGLVGRSKRRYGGYTVHAGIVLMFLGFAGERWSLTGYAFNPDKDETTWVVGATASF